MALKKVTDPTTLQSLGGGKQPVSDPALLAELNGGDMLSQQPWNEPIGTTPRPPKPKAGPVDVAVDAVKTIGGGVLGSTLGGLAGIGSHMQNALGFEETDPAATVRDIQDRFSHEPETDQLREALGLAEPILSLPQKGGEAAGDAYLDATGSPLVATIAHTMTEGAPDILGLKVPKAASAATNAAKKGVQKGAQAVADSKVVKTVAEDVSNAFPERQPVTPKPGTQAKAEVARTADLKLLPSEAGGGRAARMLESAGGKPLKQRVARRNAERTTKLAQQDTQMGPYEIDAKNVKLQTDDLASVYDEIGSLGEVKRDQQLAQDLEMVRAKAGDSMERDVAIDQLVDRYSALADSADAAQVVKSIRNKRMDAQANKSAPVGEAVKASDANLAEAELALTTALEDWLGRAAEAQGKTDLVERFRGARQSIAKLKTAQRATEGGRTSAVDLKKAKQSGEPIKERMGIAADAAEYFPESMGDVRPGKEAADVSDALFGWVKSAGSHLITPVAEKVLMSDWYQNKFGRAGDVTKLGDYFDQTPKAAPGDPSVGPPTPPPRIDFSGALGLVDTPAFESLPGGNALSRAQQAAGDLRLAEDVTPAGVAPNALRNTPDEINFEAVNPKDVGPYRIQTDMPMVAGPDVRWNPLGESVPRAGDLQLAPDFVPGPYDELPTDVGSPGGLSLADDYQGGIPFRVDPNIPDTGLELSSNVYDRLPQGSIVDELSAGLELEPPPRQPLMLPAPGQSSAIRLRDDATVQAEIMNALGLTGDIRDASLRHPGSPDFGMQQMGMQQQQLGGVVPGTKRTVSLFRGGPEGANLLDTSQTHGNALFWAPDEYGPTGARNYGSNVIQQDVTFNNLLEADTLEAVRQALGLQDSAELLDIINAARSKGHDGVTYDLKPGREYIQIPRQ